MVRLVLMFALVIVEYVYGRRPPLPPLPMKDGCFLVSPELGLFRVEGEAVILSFPMFKRVLQVRNLAPLTAKYIISKVNGTEGVVHQDGARVRQRNQQLWFLPANTSDSGEYICTYRNETYCVTGSIKVQVYEATSVDMKKLSYPIRAMVGELNVPLRCPIEDFKKPDSVIKWYKDSSSTDHQLIRGGSFRRNNAKLIIPYMKRSHAGVYTCELRVLIDNQQYKVSRTIVVHVEGVDPETPTPTVPDLSVTSNPGLISSSSHTTRHTPVIQPPVIVSPLNGTIFESLHGSGLELFCNVLTDCQTADATVVQWLVNGQSVESSYLDRRALQGGRRVTRVSEDCQIELRLIFVEMTEVDEKTELRCVAENQGGRQEVVTLFHLEDSTFTWLVVGAVATSCFLTLVSVFLYVLCKPRRKTKMDYILARQHSTF
ncbi:interleukin-1 receptor type 2 [Sparus aurata]|uniref:Interleukin 1 receptor type 2 n=1 Tax=Sparus aurata TaxID=8175 RepID=A4Q8S8_SPAAU|nr:interleukin-1 receptor type 2 [Sparus aurata]XP_030283320.1 interleukin-1 receptor type 2 [Sparus aurata]XP_030283321.1 interleukin-1 receptor type 2 [Sparus aurata]CAL30143.1 type II IL-1 receptor [Sparus aurata]